MGHFSLSKPNWEDGRECTPAAKTACISCLHLSHKTRPSSASELDKFELKVLAAPFCQGWPAYILCKLMRIR